MRLADLQRGRGRARSRLCEGRNPRRFVVARAERRGVHALGPTLVAAPGERGALRDAARRLGLAEAGLFGESVDVAVDDAARGDEWLARALDLERLLVRLVGPLQGEPAFRRLTALGLDRDAVVALDRLAEARPFRRVDAGIRERIAGHALHDGTRPCAPIPRVRS